MRIASQVLFGKLPVQKKKKRELKYLLHNTFITKQSLSLPQEPLENIKNDLYL